MSIYDSTRPSQGDSLPTELTKKRLTYWITQLFTSKGYRVWIREEVPAVIEGNPYHLDLGILCRNKESFDEYHFFGVELDWHTHESKVSDRKDRDKENAFRSISVPILRFRMEELYGNKSLSEAERDNKIWNGFFYGYFLDEPDIYVSRNQDLAIKLKESASTQCKDCQHKAHLHTLTGCLFKNTNKAKELCNCNNPYFISNA